MELQERADELSTPKAVNLSPNLIQQLRALGYIRD
jgi:hypothetical protein